MNMDALVTATEAAAGLPDVSRHLIGMWVRHGKLNVKGHRGRSPLYRWGDIVAVEAATRMSNRGRPRAADLPIAA